MPPGGQRAAGEGGGQAAAQWSWGCWALALAVVLALGWPRATWACRVSVSLRGCGHVDARRQSRALGRMRAGLIAMHSTTRAASRIGTRGPWPNGGSAPVVPVEQMDARAAGLLAVGAASITASHGHLATHGIRAAQRRNAGLPCSDSAPIRLGQRTWRGKPPTGIASLQLHVLARVVSATNTTSCSNIRQTAHTTP